MVIYHSAAHAYPRCTSGILGNAVKELDDRFEARGFPLAPGIRKSHVTPEPRPNGRNR